MKFILTRHTTTEWDLLGRIKGQTDIGLNDQGRIEAGLLAKTLFNLGINLIVSSDLKRASETAEIINATIQVPLKLEHDLRECSFGKIEGLTRQQAIEQYGPAITQSWEDQYASYDFRPFGGENREDVLTRHFQILKSIALKDANKTVLLVGHGRGMCTLLAGLGYSPDLKQGEHRVIEYNLR